MKKLIVSMIVAVTALASTAMADVTFIAGMTGVVCGGCKKNVSTAFSSLEGFKSITVKDGKELGTQIVTVVFADGAKVSKAQAIASLGDNASSYVVNTWEAKAAE